MHNDLPVDSRVGCDLRIRQMPLRKNEEAAVSVLKERLAAGSLLALRPVYRNTGKRISSVCHCFVYRSPMPWGYIRSSLPLYSKWSR